MNIFHQLRSLLGFEKEPEVHQADEVVDNYQHVSEFIEGQLDKEAKLTISIIATAIAAGDSPTSEFQVRRIQRKNPEFTKVALVAASVAAIDSVDSQWKIVSIKKRGK